MLLDELTIAKVRPWADALSHVGEPLVCQIFGDRQPPRVRDGALVRFPQQPDQLTFRFTLRTAYRPEDLSPFTSYRIESRRHRDAVRVSSPLDMPPHLLLLPSRWPLRWRFPRSTSLGHS